MQKPSDFDAIIVHQMEGEFHHDLENEGVIHITHLIINGVARVFEENEESFMTDVLRLHGMSQDDSEEIFPGYKKSMCEVIREDLKQSQVPMEVKDILQNGKIRVILLLNSFGGLLKIYKRLERLAKYVQAKGGDVVTFGGHTIASAAAHSWMLGGSKDKQFFLDNSELMFHLSSVINNPEDTRPQVDNTVEEWEKLQEFLYVRASGQNHPAIQERIQKAKKLSDTKPDRPIIFSGQEIEEIAYGTNLTDARSLQAKFVEVSGIKEMLLETELYFEGCKFPPISKASLDFDLIKGIFDKKTP